MKLKYLAITASLCAAFFAACDDSGIAPKEHIAAYDTLPRFCEESDTVRLSSTGALFYCKNGDWLEVGAIIPTKPKSSSSADKAESPDDKRAESSDDAAMESSDDADIEGSEDSGRGRNRSSSSKGESNPSGGDIEKTESSASEDSGDDCDTSTGVSDDCATSSNSQEETKSSASVETSNWVTGYTPGSLWDITTSSDYLYNVITPGLYDCTGGDPRAMEDYGNSCFETNGGWWFAYDYTVSLPGTSANVSPANTTPNGLWKLILIDYTDGSILPNGNLIEGKGFQVSLSATGAEDSPGATPGIVGIGFNWMRDESPIDLSLQNGFCIAYSWDGDIPLHLKLSWEYSYGDDWYYKELTPGAMVLNIRWQDFKKQGWNAGENAGKLQDAINESTGIRFELENHTNTEKSGTFRLSTLGWYGEC